MDSAELGNQKTKGAISEASAANQIGDTSLLRLSHGRSVPHLTVIQEKMEMTGDMGIWTRFVLPDYS